MFPLEQVKDNWTPGKCSSLFTGHCLIITTNYQTVYSGLEQKLPEVCLQTGIQLWFIYFNISQADGLILSKMGNNSLGPYNK